jgi:flagellar capping protein FliD
MTTRVVDNLNSKFTSLYSLGIKVGSTGNNDDRKKGYLLFSQGKTQSDEDYRKAILKSLKENNELIDNLKNNSTDVYKLFANDSENQSEKGIARALDEMMDGYVKRGGIFKEMTVINGSIDRELLTIFDQIKAYKMRNEKKEKSLYDQFAKMETQLSQIQAESANFMSQMGLQ